MPLIRTPNLSDTDGVYAALVEAHRGLTGAESATLNARLVLLLANHVGDAAVIEEAIGIAQRRTRRTEEATA
ncbi:MAG TPA: DUF2783 domain-containing protein [Hyphomicrobiaceae bacterium]|nr:DUF2783 domain-containing protein [Hyphomicrobiaceae bacterium]